MKTIYKHTQENILVIPQSLFTMKDVNVVRQHGNSVIFKKHLAQDLVDIEFYANMPCLIYIVSGCEILTNSNNGTIELYPGSALFLPQGVNLHSDYVKKTESLKAYLVFFNESVINQYLGNVKRNRAITIGGHDYCVVDDKKGEIADFFNSIRLEITEPSYLNVKLQELLHLIAWKGDINIFHGLLFERNTKSPKRNLQRLLEKHDILHLSVSDLAQISCRSLSSFNRDFKAIYNLTPQKWLREKRLARAKELLENEKFSVTEAASEVGYVNISNFIKAFKLKYGKTPKQIKLDN
jgi:AraC-like DNA-binding protein